MNDDLVAVTGARRWWTGPLDVDGLALDAVSRCAGAAASLGRARGRPVRVGVHTPDVAASYDSFRHLRVDGRAPVGFAPLSAFVEAADGWVRFHANYPHHRARLLSALAIDPDLDDELAATQLRAAVHRQCATDVETLVRSAGGVAAAMRSPGEWLAHDQGLAVARAPLVAVRRAEQSSGRPLPSTTGLPMAGLRVLDLTRVIAGPTATRTLGALGADVLRLEPPAIPEILDQHLDTGFAKRSAEADLADPAARDRLEELLDDADALVTGYRQGALAALGLGADDVLARHPHLVVAELSAWGFAGPWAGERGFDSIVQVATGIAHRYAAGSHPGALPVQALDHTAGYLLAAELMHALAHRDDGGAAIRVSLARVAHELQTRAPGTPDQPDERGPDGSQVDELRPDEPAGGSQAAESLPVRTDTVASSYGALVHVPPPLRIDGERLRYPTPPRPYGRDSLDWAG